MPRNNPINSLAAARKIGKILFGIVIGFNIQLDIVYVGRRPGNRSVARAGKIIDGKIIYGRSGPLLQALLAGERVWV